MNYRSLAAHNVACNEIFYRFQDCKNEHPYRRFLGYCEHIQREMIKCMREQREIRRVQSGQLRRKMFEKESGKKESSS
ncbi:hypothetical protein PUN28_012863 [Cardiocondyla obscurior]|uniref:COX assembly mitochondrial protein n=1 Tax=Cardiocondyla obscurior TaxID=286306 RepID=A0AAW2F9Q7_9HYME